MFATHFDAVNKIWSGPKIEFDLDKHKNVGEILLAALTDADPEQVMQVSKMKSESIACAFMQNWFFFFVKRLMVILVKP